MAELVSSRSAIFKAVEYMGREDLRQSPTMRDWCTTAEKKIGGMYIYERSIHVLKVERQREVLLPCETACVLGAILGKQDTDSEAIFDEYCIGRSKIDWTSLDVGIGEVVVFQPKHPEATQNQAYDLIATDKGTYMQFRIPVTETHVTVLILNYQTDEDGYILVHSDHLEAISAFIMWKVAARSRFGKNKMTMADVRENRTLWLDEKTSARINTSQVTPEQKAQMVSIFNDPVSGSAVNYY